MIPWVKNLTAAAWVTAEVRVPSPSQGSGLKDLVLLQLWGRFILQLGFSPWPGDPPTAAQEKNLFHSDQRSTMFKGVLNVTDISMAFSKVDRK